ncbi:mRNA decay activator protein ZFP36 [Megalops cyprinoides]|uniref:mRNA decay activator protein ZFP36 n=1 Tax=Megalops cyprinoides TaxID=118141 RepID=UPI0018640289|nr:mRNA decay activator protein ZFP36 [Megalops cyprinoides]
MPSYVLNPLLDFEEVLCKKFPSLDLREPPKTTALPVRPIGYKKVQTPLSLASSSLSADSREGAPMTSSHWGQYMEQSCPPLSQWNKMSFWAERSVSMVEPSTGSLRWSSPSETSQTSHCKQPVTLSSTGSAPSSSSSSSSSSRYKTELCRTFAESGVCKYGGKCQFAHGPEELRDLNRHPKYKTEPCRTFHTIGYCPYGIRCHFVHNNEDDLGPARVQPQPHRGRRPPLLRQSVSFPGFPSAPQLPEPSLPHPFLRAPSASPPMSVDVPELLSPAFPEMDSPSIFDLGLEPRPQFLPSRDPGCSFCGRIAPCPSHVPGAKAEGCPQQSPLGSLALGSRSLSYTSLSDHEGGSGSSVSSLSGSESSVFEGPSKRLPIFSQLSVPDDGFCSDGSGGSGFFL